MALELKALEDGIVSRIGRPRLKRILKDVVLDPAKLWATVRPRNFVQGIILITLYKDLTGSSYRDVQKEVAGWAHFSNEGLQHNVQKCRLALRTWAKGVVVPQTSARLTCVAAKTNRPKGLDDVVLWIDSTDFRIKGKRSVHRDRTKWSQKLQSPGRRWVTICNAKGQTQWVSPCYPPTCYDGDITVAAASELDCLFPKLHMIGDNHFRKAAPFLKSVVLHTNVAKSGRPKMVDGKKVPVTLSKEEEEWNEKISQVRGKIEAPYGWCKNTFYCLNKPFYESERQHDCVVWTAFACHHLMIGKE